MLIPVREAIAWKVYGDAPVKLTEIINILSPAQSIVSQSVNKQ